VTAPSHVTQRGSAPLRAAAQDAEPTNTASKISLIVSALLIALNSVRVPSALLPMTKSGRLDSRRPSRDSVVTRISRSRVSHQNRSLPSHCGIMVALMAIDKSAWRVAASSPVITFSRCPLHS